jgi:hypothetical protein
VHRVQKEGVDPLNGRGRNLGFLGNGMRWNERIELRLVRVMLGVRRDDLDMMMRIGRIDNVPDPEMRTERIDTVHDPEMKTERTDIDHDPTMRGVNDTAQPTGTIGKTVNLPDRDSTEKTKRGEDHVTIATHHLDQNRVDLLGMAIPNPDLGKGRGMIGIDVR